MALLEIEGSEKVLGWVFLEGTFDVFQMKQMFLVILI